LLWSDPSETAIDWEDNERGVSYCFGKKIINEFLAKFDLDLVCRAHMVVEDGYEFFNERTLVTVFSAPNYCGEFDNFGAIMSVSEELLCSFEVRFFFSNSPCAYLFYTSSQTNIPFLFSGYTAVDTCRSSIGKGKTRSRKEAS
jgi:hypothetical protein